MNSFIRARYENLQGKLPGSVMTGEISDSNSTKATDRLNANQACDVGKVRFGQGLSSILPAWKECEARFTDHTIFCDPEWLQERINEEDADIRAYLISNGSEISGAVAFELYIKQLICRLGYFDLGNIPLKVCRLLGNTPNMPEQESSYDVVVRQLLDLDFEAIYLESVKADSFSWRYLHNSALIKKHFRIFSEHGVRTHPYIRLKGSFDEYMRRFPSKTRNNFSRRIRHLRDSGKVELVRVTDESEIDAFVEAAAEISRKTYQFRALGLGIRHPDHLKKWLTWAARKRWVRSYLLKCGGVPCAFQVAYQHQRVFIGVEVGYDPAWSKYGVGIIQQLLAIEDLFKENNPDVCDFGTYAEYKDLFANDAYLDERMWLSRRRFTPLFKLSMFHFVRRASKKAASLLDKLNLKSKAKRWLRRQKTTR